MNKEQMDKYAYELMIKNNPDEVIKNLLLKDKEIKRLNSMLKATKKVLNDMDDIAGHYEHIINELEKIVKEQEDKIIIEKGQTDNQYNYDLCDSEIYAYEYVLNKLKELQGSDK